MFKKLLASLLVLLGVTSLTVSGNSWDYLPVANNYFTMDHYELEGEMYDWTFYCTRPFRIKEDTVYSLYSLQCHEYYIVNTEILFLDEDGNEILPNPPRRLRWDGTVGVIEVSFTSPVGARYLILDFSIFINSQPPRYESELHEAFAIYEGADKSSAEKYKGPDLNNAVVYQGMSGRYRTNVDAPITVSEIKSALKAIDFIDGNLTDRIEILEDRYTPNRNKVGIHSVKFGVADYSGNRTEFQVFIEVFDATPPTVAGADRLVASPLSPTSEAEVRKLLSVSDNYDEEVELEVVEDSYTPNFRKLGTYRIVYCARDSSGNETEFTVTIEVKDLDAPVITGPAKIRKSYQETLLVSEILKCYRAADDIDGDVTASLGVASDFYTQNMYKIGNWNLRLKAQDKSGNTGYFDLEIEVYDGRGPVISINRNTIEIELEDSPDLDFLVYRLRKSGDLPATGVLRIEEDGYSANKNTPGNHKVVLAGEGGIYDLQLSVKEATESKGFFASVWERIGAFFKGLFS